MRDQRIDHIGFVNELTKHFADPAKDRVKHAMALKGADRAEGDFFDALLVGGETRTIDARKFMQLLDRGRLTHSQFSQCIHVNKKAVEEFLCGEEIDRISTTSPRTPALYVTRKKDAQIELVDAIRSLGAVIEADRRNADDRQTR